MNILSRYWKIPLLPIAFVCSSCASPEFRGAWYYQSGIKEVGPLYVAMVNESDKTIHIDEITINPNDKIADHGGVWMCSPQPDPTAQVVANGDIEKGKLLVLSLPVSDDAECIVPMEARIKTNTDPGVYVDLAHALPNALPTGWRECSAYNRNNPPKQTLAAGYGASPTEVSPPKSSTDARDKGTDAPAAQKFDCQVRKDKSRGLAGS